MGGRKGGFLHFFAEGLNPSGSHMVTEEEKCKVPHGQPAAAGSSGGNPLLSLQGVLADTDSSGESGLLYGVNESTYSITANVKARGLCSVSAEG